MSAALSVSSQHTPGRSQSAVSESAERLGGGSVSSQCSRWGRFCCLPSEVSQQSASQWVVLGPSVSSQPVVRWFLLLVYCLGLPARDQEMSAAMRRGVQ